MSAPLNTVNLPQFNLIYGRYSLFCAQIITKS
jgi:hypothetical protein